MHSILETWQAKGVLATQFGLSRIADRNLVGYELEGTTDSPARRGIQPWRSVAGTRMRDQLPRTSISSVSAPLCRRNSSVY